jgi:hypothetical protein
VTISSRALFQRQKCASFFPHHHRTLTTLRPLSLSPPRRNTYTRVPFAMAGGAARALHRRQDGRHLWRRQQCKREQQSARELVAAQLERLLTREVPTSGGHPAAVLPLLPLYRVRPHGGQGGGGGLLPEPVRVLCHSG